MFWKKNRYSVWGHVFSAKYHCDCNNDVYEARKDVIKSKKAGAKKLWKQIFAFIVLQAFSLCVCLLFAFEFKCTYIVSFNGPAINVLHLCSCVILYDYYYDIYYIGCVCVCQINLFHSVTIILQLKIWKIKQLNDFRTSVREAAKKTIAYNKYMNISASKWSICNGTFACWVFQSIDLKLLVNEHTHNISIIVAKNTVVTWQLFAAAKNSWQLNRTDGKMTLKGKKTLKS